MVALSFPEATEAPHFEKPSFRIKNKIFAGFDSKNQQACIKLSETDQDLYSSFDRTIIFPVPNKWGKQGWTFIQLDLIPEELFIAALKSSYCQVAPNRFAQIILSSMT